MSIISITNVCIPETKSHFLAPYSFEVTFECLSPLEDDLEFKLVYVSSAENTTKDQELDSLLVGPVPVGVNKFVFKADAPHVDKIPKEDLIGVTVILLTCSYKDKEFVRIGYYVDNAYIDSALLESPPDVPQVDKIYRSILADKPRVTRFPINWDDPSKEDAPPAQPTDGEMLDEDAMDADNQFDEGAVVGGNGDEDEGEDEDDEDEEEDDEDEDERGEVDLAALEDRDEAEGMSDEDEAVEEDEEMADINVAQPMSACAGSMPNPVIYDSVTMEVE
ncbi:Histone chaperone asf1 [Coemansia sp. S610]|nr:Histone chaperone asf1 [Coemansia sp. RSA 2675]KAJ2030203.1 Histone chaperone asf1 [Coemansia sp. S610]KAJ2384604.1 Histone chaperone asf1 [Coemansia sp. RSA 2611]KAJ2404962.1 Histone chaperone asf1 [Coemansia sp. RSA 2530]KAJ2702378.1 Histone chaperone asf1 [Coemansia sp. IMI 209128]